MAQEAAEILTLALLPHPQLSFFPGCLANLREPEGSPLQKAALDHAARSGEQLFWVKQRGPSIASPKTGDLYRIGTIAKHGDTYSRDGLSHVRLVGENRGELLGIEEEQGLLKARVRLLPHVSAAGEVAEKLIQQALDTYEQYFDLCDALGIDLPGMWTAAPGSNLEDYVRFGDILAFHAQFRVENGKVAFFDVQQLLEEQDPLERLRLLEQFFRHQADVLKSDPELPRKLEQRQEKRRREEEEWRVQREEKLTRLREIVAREISASPQQPSGARAATEMMEVPMVPLRDVVLFPGMEAPFIAGRKATIAAIEQAWRRDRRLFVAAQHDAEMDFPTADQIFKTGVLCTILDQRKLPDDNLKVTIRGDAVGRILDLQTREEIYLARIEVSNPAVAPELASGRKAALELLSELSLPVQERQSLLEEYDADYASWMAKCLRAVEHVDKPSNA